jgi:hypothetical protein
VMAVACFFSWQNRQTFVDIRTQRHATDKNIEKELKTLSVAATEVDSLKKSVAAMAAEREQEEGRRDQVKIKLKNVESEAARTTSDIATADGEIKDIKAKMDKLPEGITIDTISEDINKLKQTIAANEDKAAKAKEETVAKEKDLKKEQAELEDIIKRIDERKKLFERNSLSATIIAVNNDWGFVVIDAGKNKEISADTKLLVTRGTETIGSLNIVSVEGNRTVANIVQKSLRRGLAVAPGDKVILETLYQ